MIDDFNEVPFEGHISEISKIQRNLVDMVQNTVLNLDVELESGSACVNNLRRVVEGLRSSNKLTEDQSEIFKELYLELNEFYVQYVSNNISHGYAETELTQYYAGLAKLNEIVARFDEFIAATAPVPVEMSAEEAERKILAAEYKSVLESYIRIRTNFLAGREKNKKERNPQTIRTSTLSFIVYVEMIELIGQMVDVKTVQTDDALTTNQQIDNFSNEQYAATISALKEAQAFMYLYDRAFAFRMDASFDHQRPSNFALLDDIIESIGSAIDLERELDANALQQTVRIFREKAAAGQLKRMCDPALLELLSDDPTTTDRRTDNNEMRVIRTLFKAVLEGRDPILTTEAGKQVELPYTQIALLFNHLFKLN